LSFLDKIVVCYGLPVILVSRTFAGLSFTYAVNCTDQPDAAFEEKDLLVGIGLFGGPLTHSIFGRETVPRPLCEAIH